MTLIRRTYSKVRRIAKRLQILHVNKNDISIAESFVGRARNTVFPTVRTTNFSSLQAFLKTPTTPSGVLSVWHRGLPIDMSLSIRKRAPLIVVFHGAADIEVKLPWLSGGGVLNGLRVSRLSISDPSLYISSDLNLSWFAGSILQPDISDALSEIIKKVKDSTGSSKVILFGGSGGGFASLRLAPTIPGSIAVVMNPQTDIEKYHPNHVKKYVDIAWAEDVELMRSSISTDVSSVIRGREENVSVFYLQNEADTYHVSAHLQPFIENFKDTKGFYLLNKAWRDGHTPPPKELISEVLEAIVNDDYDKLKNKLGFTPL